MKTILKILIHIFTIIAFYNTVYAQSDISGVGTGHNGGTGYYCGWNATANQTFDIKNNATQPINFYTGGTLLGLFTAGGILTNGTYTGDGLRLVDPGAGPGNLDLWSSTDNTSHIRWGESGNIDAQNSRFEVTGRLNGLWLNANLAPSSPGSANVFFNLDGTEVGRIQNSGTSADVGFWGIGKGFATTPPVVTLDVHGQEDLETVNNQDSLARVLVWDYSNPTLPGNIKWRRASSIFPGAQNGTRVEPTSGKVELGFNPLLYNTNIPLAGYNLTMDDAAAGGRVGIGIDPDHARLSVKSDYDDGSGFNMGINSFAFGNSTVVTGVDGDAEASPTTIWNRGLFGGALYGTALNCGVYGVAQYASGMSVGVYGIATNSSSNYGVYGEGSTYGGYFTGNLAYTGILNPPSDSVLKVDVQQFSGDSALIYLRNLRPKTYEFDNESYGFMYLPENWQYGLIAQDVNRVLPNLVTRNLFPAQYDSTGTLVHDTVGYCGLNYTGLIPILVAGVKQLDSLQNNLPNQVNNGLSADSTTHKLQWGGSPLKHSTEMPMVDTTGGIDSVYNIYFSGQNHYEGVNRGNVGIGYNKDSNLIAKLSVLDSVVYWDDVPTMCASFHLAGTNDWYSPNIGVNAITDVTHGSINTGVYGMAKNGYYSYGVWGDAEGPSESWGVFGQAYGGSYENVGLYGFASHVDEALNAGVLGEVTDGSDYAGYFEGSVYTTGSYLPSDSKLKTNVQDVSNASALSIINSLKPKTYTYNTQQFPTMELPTEQQYGLISEDVEKVLPTLVKDSRTPPKLDSTGKIINPSIEFKALNYTALVPILIAATKQLDSTNTAQQNKIDSLQSQLAQINTALQQLQNCCAQNNSGTQSGDRQESVVLTNTNAIILDQNAPNPFAEQTTITYTIPESVSNAQLIFSDISGNVIKTVQIQSRGAGSLLVYASNLSSGLYTYSLIADGKLIDTKKMTIQK